MALVHLSRFNLSKGSEPQLLVRDGINPNNVFPGSKPGQLNPKRGKKYAQSKQAFEHNRAKYRVWADEMRIVKTCTRDGTAILSYEIRNFETAGHTLKKFTLM